MDRSPAVGDGATQQPSADDMEPPSPTPPSHASMPHAAPKSSRHSSATTSPTPSLDSSPVTSNQPCRQQTPSLAPGRSRQTKPAEKATTTTTTLSSATTPDLRPSNRESQAQKPSAPQKPPALQELKDSHRWPVSPRLRSPPPQLSKPQAARRGDHDTPLISVQRPTLPPLPPDAPQQPPPLDHEPDDSLMLSGIRTPIRGPLETVQEVSQNNSPAAPLNSAPSSSAQPDQVKDGKPAGPDCHSDSDGGRAHVAKASATSTHPPAAEAGTAAPRPDMQRPPPLPPTPGLISRQSSAVSTKQLKPKTEGSTQTMTVETETVPSVPQVVLSTGTKSEGANGTLKAKPSAETIKPKRDKKKPARKQPPVNSGTGSSKADIFEAKIASAVDEANTSDSEETFVYDSNPPDNTERTNRRFHSRTPSATSMVSQADRNNLRSIYGVMEGAGHTHGPVPKKSMKFVNTFGGGGNASDGLTPGDEDGKGTGRSAGGSARGTLRHHHHIGRWGRQPGNGHASLFDNESPFQNAAAKSKLQPRDGPGPPPSPRIYQSARGHLSTKRSSMQMSSSYDMDDTGADDERTPLLETTARSLRGSRSRRGPHNLRQAESQQTYTRPSSYLNRFAACLVLTIMFLLVITGAIGFMFATSQPMTDIEIVSIGNVVTSEQVLMFDLTVKAHNPNIVVITIDHANLEIFAKSEFATPYWYTDDDAHLLDDPLNDPPLGPGDDGDGDNDSRPNLLLGRVSSFDSSLTFEGSLFHQGTSKSTAEMQLPYPGNNTFGGSARWVRIHQHEFDLIVKGVVKYSLPLSAHVRSATVAGRTTVKPNSANKPSPKPNKTTTADVRYGASAWVG
ncbi:phospholipid metabolism enzyme regulator [Ophiocordyceps camponoti-floridani]|uniref:Phospholipid metabolism enzyme regulator n=1 Tax=Ophiocordyceps camponoti-floridani TaxID=2030778 RepID=A0A8H4Q9M6_9HYPO|nr:phospholipid metabolism enzyme regulator [Ophiocordyceps camponoti-floridani]